MPGSAILSLVDGLVLARDAFRHSVNYRSVVLFGEARCVEDKTEKLAALRDFVEQLVPGRWADLQPPSPNELRATSVLALPIDEASAKIRSGPPHSDADEDEPSPWTGVLPLRLEALEPQASDRGPAELTPPPYVQHYSRTRT